MESLSEAAKLPNLWSPECLARGLPQGGKPTSKSVRRRTVRRLRGRKAKRISESELHGAVNCNPVALLTRGSLRARGWWDLLLGSPTVIDNPAGLTSRIRLGRVWNHRNWDMLFVARSGVTPGSRCRPARLFKEGEPVCGERQRIVDQAKARGNARDTGVVPGLRTRPREPNSTIAEEVKVKLPQRSYGRQAC